MASVPRRRSGRALFELTVFTDEPRDQIARMLAGQPAYQYETRRRRKDGTIIEVLMTISPWQLDGEVVGVTGISIDLTERKRVERAREQALADLQEAQRIAGVGSWAWDPSTDQASWSAQMYEIFGRDPVLGPVTGEALLEYVAPEDRERVAAGYAQVLGGGPRFELDYRINAGDGVQRTLHADGHADSSRPGGYVGTVQDVTEQRRAERERIELLEASARAESANRAKSEFLARMSHELRTPLNSIIGFSQLVELDGLAPQQSEHVGYVLKAAGHLLELINEVLELARIEAGQMTISPEPVALADTIREVLALVAPLARDRDVTLRNDTAGLAHDGHVHADRHRLKQVLLNVLSNAIKYNRPGGRVDVSFQITPAGRVRTTIADTGIGIHPDQLAKLFEPFERLGAELTQVEGTGLGLALSKGLIEAMGGTIDVDSDPGTGTAVTIELAGAEPPGAKHEPGPQDRELADLAGPGKRHANPLHRGQPLQPDTRGTNPGSIPRGRATPRDARHDRGPAGARPSPGPDRARPAPPRHAGHRGPQTPQSRPADTRDPRPRPHRRRQQRPITTRQGPRSSRIPHQTPRRPQIPQSHRRQSRRTTHLISPAARSRRKPRSP